MDPTILYKCPGSNLMPGGTFAWRAVKTQQEYNELISAGWHTTLTAASTPNIKQDEPVQVAVPPVPRKDLEVEATKIGVKHPAKLSSNKLAQLIAESEPAK